MYFVCLGAAVRRHSSAEGSSLWPEELQCHFTMSFHLAGNQHLTLPVEPRTWVCTPEAEWTCASDSSGCRRLPLALGWHTLFARYSSLCAVWWHPNLTEGDWTLSIAQRDDWSQATADPKCFLRAGVTKSHTSEEKVSSLDSNSYINTDTKTHWV